MAAMDTALFAGIVVFLPLLIAVWIKGLLTLYGETQALKARAAGARSYGEREETLEHLSEANARLILGAVFMLSMLAGSVYLLTHLEPGALVPLDERNASVEDIVSWTQRGLIGIAILLISYGLAAAVLPKIIPEEGTRANAFLSQVIAWSLAATFALSAVSSDDVYNRMRERINSIFSDAVFTVLAILGLGISLYLAWAKGKVLLKPTRRSGGN